MKSSSVILPLTVLLFSFMVSCHSGRHKEMQRQLETLSLHNQQDSVLTNDSLAQALADWFDDHGKPNEQVLAHYLLGRTHADRGEAPAAIDAYHDAIDHADTTAQDCDYGQLSKVYGQMGELFYWQNLLQNALWAYGMAYRNAMASSDTLLALAYFSQKGKCYYDMGKTDSLKNVTLEVRNLYLQFGDTLNANTVIEPLIYLAVEEKDFNKAAEYIDLYVQSSLIATDTTRYHEFWAQFTIHKGLYFKGLHQPDSALNCLRTGLSITDNPYTRLMAYQGIYETYKELGIADSIVKYAEISLRANDSTVSTHISDQMQRMQALYNYDRFRHEADRMTVEADRAEQKVTFLSLVLICIISIAVIISAVAIIHRHRRHAKRLKLKVRYTADALLFKSYNDELRNSTLRTEKGEELAEKIQFLEKSLSNKPKELKAEVLTESFQECDIVVLARKYGDEGKLLPDACWVRLRQAINVYAPTFMDSISKLKPGLDITDTHLCQISLIRNMPQKAKAAVMGLEYHAAAMKRKRLFKALTGKEGSAKDLEEMLQETAFGSF